MKSLRAYRKRSKGTGLVIWSSIFILFSVLIPGFATVISFLIALGLHKHPERREVEIILILISIIITIVLWMTGFLSWYWSSFMAGYRSVH